VLVMTKIWLACSNSAGDVDFVTDRKAMPWAELQLSPYCSTHAINYATQQHSMLVDSLSHAACEACEGRVNACIAARLPVPCHHCIHISLQPEQGSTPVARLKMRSVLLS